MKIVFDFVKLLSICLLVLYTGVAKCDDEYYQNDDYSDAADILKRKSYAWEDRTCQTAGWNMGYWPQEGMNPNNPSGFFDPVIGVRQGTYSLFGDSCNRMSGSGARGVLKPKQCEYIFPAGSVCATTGYVSSYRYEELSSSEKKKLDKAPSRYSKEIEDLKANRGKYGREYDGERVICAYYRVFGCNGHEHDCDIIGKQIKCTRIPVPPKPRPFCEVLPIATSLKLSYIKPTENNNTYFVPRAKIVYSETRKKCKDDSIVGIDGTCSDGDDGQIIFVSAYEILEAFVDPDNIKEVSESEISLSLGGSDFVFKVKVDNSDVCVSYRDPQGSQVSLGCVPRTPSEKPVLSHDSMGGYSGETELVATFLDAHSHPHNGAVVVPSVGLEYLYSKEDASELFFGMKLSAMRTSWNPKDGNEDVLEPKRVCIRPVFDESSRSSYTNGNNSGRQRFFNKSKNVDEYKDLIPAKKRIGVSGRQKPAFKDEKNRELNIRDNRTSKFEDDNRVDVKIVDTDKNCDDAFDINAFNGFQCSTLEYVRNKEDCLDPSSAVSASIKECSPDVFVSANHACYLGTIDYEDDQDGSKICLRGYTGERMNYYVIRSGQRVYFRDSPVLLHPVKVHNGNIVDDNGSRTKQNIRAIDQEILDEMTIDARGLFSFPQISGSPLYGLYQNKKVSFVDSNKNTTLFVTPSSDSEPFFLGNEEEAIPVDPVEEDLCTEIMHDSWPPSNMETVEYDQAGLYISHDPTGVVDTRSDKDSSGNYPANYFEDFVQMMNPRSNSPVVIDIPIKSPSSNSISMNTSKAGFVDINSTASDDDGRSWKHYSSTKNLNNYTAEHELDHLLMARFVERYLDGSGSTSPIQNNSTNPPLLSGTGLLGFVDSRLDPSTCRELEFELWGAGGTGRGTKYSDNNDNCTYDASSGNGYSYCGRASAGETGAYFKGKIRLRNGSDPKIAVILGNTLETAKPSDQETVNEGTPTAIWLSEYNKTFKLVAKVNAGTNRSGFYTSTMSPDVQGKTGEYVTKTYDNLLKAEHYGVTAAYKGNTSDKKAPIVKLKTGIKGRDSTVVWDNFRVVPLERRFVGVNCFCGRNTKDQGFAMGGSMSSPVEVFQDLNGTTSQPIVPADELGSNPMEKNNDLNYTGTWVLHQRLAFLVNKKSSQFAEYQRDKYHDGIKNFCWYAYDLRLKYGDAQGDTSTTCIRSVGKMKCHSQGSGGPDNKNYDGFIYKIEHDNRKNGTEKVFGPPARKCKGFGGGYYAMRNGDQFGIRGASGYVKIRCTH